MSLFSNHICFMEMYLVPCLYVGFFNIVALPMYNAFVRAFPDTAPMLHAVQVSLHAEAYLVFPQPSS